MAATTQLSPQQRTFGTVELLEMIALHLPCADIENLRLISTYWKAAIDGSPKLDKKRFLRPDGSAQGRPVHIWVTGHMVTPSGNFTAPAEGETSSPYPYPDAEIARRIVVSHPKLRIGMATRLWPEAVVEVSFPADLKTMLSWPQGGRWENVQITRPFVREMQVYIYSSSPRNFKCVEIENQQGLTLGDIVGGLRWMVYPYDLPHNGKTLKPSIDLNYYREVVGLLENVVTPDSVWVRQARISEILKEDLRRAEEEDEQAESRVGGDAEVDMEESEASADEMNPSASPPTSKRNIDEQLGESDAEEPAERLSKHRRLI